MEESILVSTKNILGIDESYKAFDLDIITHINAALSTLHQLGIGTPAVYSIDDESFTWNDLNLPKPQLSMVKTYIYLKVRLVFDPPGTSFHLEAAKEQIRELEWRMNVYREEALHGPVV